MKKTLILALVFVPFLTAHADLITLPNEPDVCSNIEGHQYPAPSGWHAESDGTCTLLQEPVHIDIVPPGGEPQSIDITPPGGQSQTIDVNPANPGGTGGGTITSKEELQNFVLNANSTTQERVDTLEARKKAQESMAILQVQLVKLLTQLIQQLQAKLATMQ